MGHHQALHPMVCKHVALISSWACTPARCHAQHTHSTLQLCGKVTSQIWGEEWISRCMLRIQVLVCCVLALDSVDMFGPEWSRLSRSALGAHTLQVSNDELRTSRLSS